MLVDGITVERTGLVPGQVVLLGRVALLMCVERPELLPALDLEHWPGPLHPFGAPDAFGLVGESPLAWELRAQLGFIGGRAAHVLIRGASGTGKELAAQAIHALSPRAARPLVARNAATFPETLLDAELFGNVKNFPNVGTPERPGLIGEANGGTLFLDEFGELPVAAQAHLLRVLDAGEYARLGEARPRRADLRLLAATNRPEAALKEDVLARLRLRLELPGIDRRREDIPQLAVHLLRRIARHDPGVARRCFPDGDPGKPPRITIKLMDILVRWPYTTHVRELEALLWRAMSSGTGDALDCWPDAAPLAATVPTAAAAGRPPEVDPMSIPAELLQARLDAHGGRQEPVWREFGFSSRHVLTRLVRRHNLRVRGRTGDDDDDKS
jgi:two-component system nitrogen regulation response regulator GlnG/two-component system response regulator HydG